MRTKGRTIEVFYTIAKLLKEEGQMVIITNKDNVGDLVNTNVTFKTETKEWAKIQRTE